MQLVAAAAALWIKSMLKQLDLIGSRATCRILSWHTADLRFRIWWLRLLLCGSERALQYKTQPFKIIIHTACKLDLCCSLLLLLLLLLCQGLADARNLNG
jgi:hypothetical protein